MRGEKGERRQAGRQADKGSYLEIEVVGLGGVARVGGVGRLVGPGVGRPVVVVLHHTHH